MTSRVDEDPPIIGLGLDLSFHRTDLEHEALALVEVGDVEVEVGLLGRTPRPSRGLVVGVELEAQIRCPVDMKPLPVAGRRLGLDLATDDLLVEGGERRGVGTVEGHQAEFRNRHGGNATACRRRISRVSGMPDPIFADPRLARLYDDLDPDRGDLEVYVEIIDRLGGRSVLDIGCGTGTFACMLAPRGLEVIGVDPAAASIDVARAKPEAAGVRWIHGDATQLPAMAVDVVTMTANVAQVFLTDDDWSNLLDGVVRALRPGGHLVFETRDPAAQAWLGWNRTTTFSVTEVPEVGTVETWTEILEVREPLVSFRSHFRFPASGTSLVSDSTLRFREREEIETSLNEAGFLALDLRDAPDRPGRELVFIAQLNSGV